MRHLATAVVAATTILLLSGCGSDAEPDEITTSMANGAVTTTSSADETTTTGAVATTTTTEPATTTTTEPATTTTLGVQAFNFVVNGNEVDGPERVEVARNSTVNLIVTGDVTDEVHLHGYDLFVDLTPQSAAIIEFVAEIAGIFEVELEESGLLLTEVVVR